MRFGSLPCAMTSMRLMILVVARIITVSFLVLPSWSETALAQVLSCEIAKLFELPEIKENEKFWNEFSKLQTVDNKTVKDLVTRYVTPEGSSAADASSASRHLAAQMSTPNVVMKKKAIKDADKLAPSLRSKFDEFLEIASEGSEGVRKFHENPGRWRFEKVNGFGPDRYTTRLNDGYRVLFHLSNEGKFEIEDISKSKTH